MKRLFLNLIPAIAVLIFASAAANGQDFSGKWQIDSDEVSFTLEVEQDGKNISGTYSYVTAPDAKRIREGKFTGKITDETAEISFQNDEYDFEKGTAQLQLVTETIIWTMDERTAEFLLLPASFNLEKVISKK